MVTLDNKPLSKFAVVILSSLFAFHLVFYPCYLLGMVILDNKPLTKFASGILSLLFAWDGEIL